MAEYICVVRVYVWWTDWVHLNVEKWHKMKRKLQNMYHCQNLMTRNANKCKNHKTVNKTKTWPWSLFRAPFMKDWLCLQMYSMCTRSDMIIHLLSVVLSLSFLSPLPLSLSPPSSLFTNHNLFHPRQSGFMKNHSCHTLLTNLIEQWHENINNDLLSFLSRCDYHELRFFRMKSHVVQISPRS